jgi:hypothetical protein
MFVAKVFAEQKLGQRTQAITDSILRRDAYRYVIYLNIYITHYPSHAKVGSEAVNFCVAPILGGQNVSNCFQGGRIEMIPLDYIPQVLSFQVKVFL